MIININGKKAKTNLKKVYNKAKVKATNKANSLLSFLGVSISYDK